MTSYDQFTMLLPFAHFGVWVILWGLLFLISIGKNNASTYSPYIKSAYPDVWKKLHPWGDLSHGFGYFAFMFGKYDNGEDEVLNEIKFQEKVRVKLLLWPFFLVVGIWGINILLILLKSIT